MAYISNLILSKDDGLANARKELMETIESYDSILEGLIDGNKELGTSKLNDNQIREKVQLLKEIWIERYKNAYLSIYFKGTSGDKTLIYEDFLGYMNLIDEVLALYSKYSKDKVMKAIYMNGLLTLVLAFNSTYCFNSVNNRIKKPVYTLLKELKDIADKII